MHQWHSFGEVLGGADPTLGDATVEVTLTNTAPGAPLPDLSQVQSCPEPGQEIKVFAIDADADGPLRNGFGGVPDGTPGHMELKPHGAKTTGIEKITIRAVKK